MLLAHRTDLTRDPLILGQLYATNIFTTEMHEVEALPEAKPEAVVGLAKAESSSEGSSSSSESEEV